EKRVSSTASNNMMSASASFIEAAPKSGSVVLYSYDQVYTIQIKLHLVSATQMDVSSTLFQGSDTGTVLSQSTTASDVGSGDSSTATFGGTALGANVGVPGNAAPYVKFDQLFFRLATGNASGLTGNDIGEIDINNFKVALSSATAGPL